MVVAMKGWSPVATTAVESTPPGKLVGATLSCMEVELHTKNADKEAQDSAQTTQYALFLFGGDDADGKQTNALHVFYLQEKRWVVPRTLGSAPARRSRHTATVVSGEVSGGSKGQLLLVFGGVGASNAMSMLDPATMEWSLPPTRSKEVKATKSKKKKGSKDDATSASTQLPCPRFGHSAATFEQTLYVFGGQDHKGPLGELYALKLPESPMEWSCCEVGGYPPPPAANHACAVVRDHLLLICGDDSWEGHLWAARLRGPLTWFRSAVSEFPLLGVQRHSAAAFVTPRPHRREEVLVFGGVIGRDIVDIFMTLDTRTWEETEAVLPQERWKEVEARLKAKGLEEHEINQHKTDWQVRADTRAELPHLSRISPRISSRISPISFASLIRTK